MDQDIRQYLTKAKEQQDSGALQSAYQLIKDSIAVAGTSGRTPCIAPELYVVCAEAALQLGCLEISTACLKMYFEGNPPANQFLCRAYLCQGQLKSPPATGSVEDFEEAVLYFLKAIEISKREPRYHFIVFNASVLYFQTVCLLLLPGRCLHLVPSLRQVVQSLEDVADQDHSWRAELMASLKSFGGLWKKGRGCNLSQKLQKILNRHIPPFFTKGDPLYNREKQNFSL
ncbi:cilia- and flagella-associated protein 46 [Etheostoma spectabile]|uniref:cilia- and flagella-associated protein 46 n=1 Tax=Etheostoma spectabile TaxID=54343 RepID=UPI0013AFB099|nr:cilia- and flagella-associated protein 46-like [Etheostoma spectabile]